MGTYRLFLAYCVLHSHVFGNVFGWNIGVVAVISFFVISGYVMAFLIAKHYRTVHRVPAFYIDRAARLFPQYLAYLALTLALAAALALPEAYLQARDAYHVFMNALMVPIGYNMFLGMDKGVFIPQGWSLGLELTFYLIFPLFWLAPIRIRAALVVASAAVFVAAYLGVIDTAKFGYFLLPGTFFMFAAGAALMKPEVLGEFYPGLVFVGAAAAAMFLLISPSLLALPYNKEVTTGIAIGVLAVFLLRDARSSFFDELMGNLSYGVFLNHMLMMALADHWGVDRLFVPAASLVVAGGSYKLVEEPAVRWRHRLRAQPGWSQVAASDGPAA